MTKEQKEELANRLARTVIDAINRTGETPTEEEIKEAVLYLLNTI